MEPLNTCVIDDLVQTPGYTMNATHALQIIIWQLCLLEKNHFFANKGPGRSKQISPCREMRIKEKHFWISSRSDKIMTLGDLLPVQNVTWRVLMKHVQNLWCVYSDFTCFGALPLGLVSLWFMFIPFLKPCVLSEQTSPLTLPEKFYSPTLHCHLCFN